MTVWQNPERKIWEPPKEEVKESPFPLKPGESFNFKENGSGYNPNPEVPYVPKGWGAVGTDIQQMLGNAGPEALAAIPEILKGLYQSGKQAVTNPVRFGGNLAAGIPEMFKQGYNVGPRALSYLGEKGIVPQSLQYGAERAKIGETGLRKRLFGEEQPGDIFTESLAPFIAFKTPLAANPITGTAAITALQGGNPAAGALLAGGVKGATKVVGGVKNEIQNKRAINEMQKQLPTYEESIKGAEQQTAESAIQLDEANKLQEEATSHFPREYERLQDEKFALQEQELASQQEVFAKQQEQAQRQQQAQKKLEEVKYETGHASSRALNNKIKSTQEALEKLNEEIISAPDISHLPQAEKIFTESEKQLIETEKKLSTTEEIINKKLGKGASHNERVAKLIYEPQKAIEKEIGGEYRAIEEESKPFDIPLKENPELIQLEKDLRALAPNATDVEFSKLLDSASKQLNFGAEKSIPAKEYLQKWRSVRNAGYEAIEQSREKGGSATEEGARLRSAGENALSEADKMLKIYQQYVPQEIFNRLMATNEAYKTRVAPLKQNTTWRAIERNKKIPGKDLIEVFKGEKEGQAQLREHILNNPEAAELMLGSRMAGKPNIWNEYHEASLPYLEKVSPETLEMLRSHAELNKTIPKIKETVKQSQETIKKLSPERVRIMENQKKVESLMKELDEQKSVLSELKKAEKEAREARNAPKEEKINIIEHKKKIANIERQKKSMQQIEQEHKTEVVRKKQEHIKNKERESEYKKAQAERQKKIKEAESKLKITKGKLMSLALKGTAGALGASILGKMF